MREPRDLTDLARALVMSGRAKPVVLKNYEASQSDPELREALNMVIEHAVETLAGVTPSKQELLS